jgi:hypothetical protein
MSPSFNERSRNDRSSTRDYNDVAATPVDNSYNHISFAQSVTASYDNIMENQYNSNGPNGYNIIQPDDCVPKWDGSMDIKDTVAKYVYQ